MNSNFSLQLLENMCIHSHLYLNEKIDQYYEYFGNQKYIKSDIKILKNISQPYFGMVYQGYYKSKKETEKQCGVRGVIQLVVDKNVCEDFYKKCIEKGYYVIKYKISDKIEKETNINGPFIPFQWKFDENNDKVAYGRIWNDIHPFVELVNNIFENYYMLKVEDMYTESHQFYYMQIVDYEETSNDFLKRFYAFLVDTYGKPTIKNMDNVKMSQYYGFIYTNVIQKIYRNDEDEEDDDEDDDEDDENIECCPNCKHEAQDTDDEKDDCYENQDSDCDTDVE